ncbi:hypothetical protein J1614_000131 [Plenodomus biglobosus]|nr:hypothetical protein J1614_000131 [Plenodomus biglobosus]
MADWAEFQQKADSVVPAKELKPKRCWIGVLSHEKRPNDRLSESDFVWMIGHSMSHGNREFKITTQKIYETYQKRFNVEGLELKHKGILVDTGDIVKSFQTPGENLVLFLASRPEKVRTPPRSIGSTDLARPSENSPTTRLVSRTRSVPPLDGVLEMKMSRCIGATSSNPVRHETSPMTVLPEPSGVDHQRTGSGASTLAHAPATTALTTPGVSTPHRNQAELTDRATLWEGHQETSYRSPYLDGVNQVPSLPSALSWNVPNVAPSAPLIPVIPASTGTHADFLSHASATISGETAVKSEQHRPISHTNFSSISGAGDGSMPQFDFEEVFQRQQSPPDGQEEVAVLSQRHIRAIIDQQNPLVLEAGVSKATTVLETLRAKFAQHATTNVESESWVQAIDKLMPQAERKRTVVGVVGNTGAGKSSVINALLDEERLVPTNCMRACTAVVTEISWNPSTNFSDKYRAEIEFIGHADWEKELHILLKEFLTDNGTVSRDVSDPNSDAGIAWAKFHSVYPDIHRDSLGEWTVSSLMAKPAIAQILGTTKKITTAMPGRFYIELQRYVDNKEKVIKKGKDKDKEKKSRSQMEYWPLIKVVKIYTKSPALSTGACIVDLPGVHDSNAARAAVAQGYMKQCTGLWIVAPINRAVDDKAAKTLLGDSFKRQLKYDGGFSSITFICSKTDDISITEAIDSLELEDEIATFEHERTECTKQIEKIEKQLLKLKDEQADYKVAQRNASEEIEEWENLKDLLDDGKVVYAPLPAPKKRKRGRSGKEPRKKSARHDDDANDDSDEDSDDDFLVTDHEETENDEAYIDDAQRTPLSEADIKQNLKILRDVKKDARRAAAEKKREMDELEPQIQELNNRMNEIKAKISHICIAERNEYSKTAIQTDVAAGIKEIDQENAAEEAEDNFNPEEEIRDYDQVAKSLPVFCVSSRAYQKMQGRLAKDDGVPGFVTPEETEIPQLQAHCKKLTESGRIQTARTFLLNLCQILTTFHLWASDDGTGMKMTDEDKAKQVGYLKRRLEQLETGLEQAVHTCINEMRAELKNQIFDKCPELINDAIKTAPTTALAWGQKDMGGLVWSTYKAVVRRDGVYQSSSAGLRDFNADLIDPIIKKLATGWERAFQNRLPKAFQTYVANSRRVLHAFHTAVEERARRNGVGLASLTILKTQIHTYEHLYANLGTLLITQMTELQREANRDFTPTIASIMHAVYDACTVERGPGSFNRMKELMIIHVERERHRMFHDATKTVEKHLDLMDYMQALAGRDIQGPVLLRGREEREIRKEIRGLILDVDEQFADIANGNLDIWVAEEEVEKSTVTVGDENGVFGDAQESVSDQDNNEDSIMTGVDDSMITEPTPTKPSASPISEHRGYQAANREDNTDSDF